jgi:hypothetical protein
VSFGRTLPAGIRSSHVSETGGASSATALAGGAGGAIAESEGPALERPARR